MNFTKTDAKTVLLVAVGVMVAGAGLFFGRNLPGLNKAASGFGA